MTIPSMGARVLATSYLDVHRQMATEIDAEREAVLALLGPSAPALRAAVAALLRHRAFKYPLSVLPLMVHAVETGSARPALPLAVVHELWWTSACTLDDLADSPGTGVSGVTGFAGDLDAGDAFLATVVAAAPLPLLAVRSSRVPEALHGPLAEEIIRCWVGASEGQLWDLHGSTADVTRASVGAAYRGKSGSPFSMITAMAALLAGAPEPRVEQWREFGDVFGVLWQLLNDQEDLLSGRNEDLRNGTATYLLACALEEAPTTGPDAGLRQLRADARDSETARAELARHLLAPAVLRRYEEDTGRFRDQAHRLLDGFGGERACLPALKDLVDRTAVVLLRPDTSLSVR